MATAAGFQAVRGVFAREGEYWTLAYRDRIARLADSKGLRQIAYLLSHPGREVHALDLIALTDQPSKQVCPGEGSDLSVRAGPQGDTGELLDAKARAAYTRRLKELREELDEVRKRGLESRAVAAEAEIDALTAHLKSSLGLGGRARKSGSAAERARLTVGKSIGRAIESIAAANPELGRLFETTIKTGTFCCYQPDPRFPVQWHQDEKRHPAVDAPPAQGTLAAKQAPQRISLSAPESEDSGERKTVTVLCANIEGSMELIGHLDPEEAGAIVEPALKLMMDAVHRYGGYVAQSASDGIFALFGAPIAQEDHPQRALFAALRVQEVFARYAEKLHGEKGVDLQVRVGVNSGEVVVRSIKSGAGQTYIPIGRSSSLASQLLALAAPGSIAISGAMRKLVEGYFTLKPMEPTRIKGVSEPVEVYEVTGLGPLRTRLQRAAGRGLSKFVGRGPEIQAIERAAELAKAGRGQVVAAVAEPGVGKSRLYYEFEVRNQSGWMVMAFAVSHGKASAYLPVIDLLHVYFGIDSGDDVHKRREKVRGKVLMLDRALEGILPYLFALLGIAEGEPFAGMDAAVRRRRTLDAIKRILIRESLNQPLMLVFEDLHWIDEETRGLLNLMTESIGSARILLLVNYRPEYQQEWSNKTSHTQLRLEPLGKESADEMLTALLGDASDIAPLKRLIIERTEGNPFFLEETFEALLDDGALVRNGSIKLVKPLAELKIPPTVQDILASRIDRLPAAEKQLLQAAAVIGKVFGLKLLAQAAGKTAVELIPMLSELEKREFTYETISADDIEYTFKHALTQEVAYNSVLAERRKITHRVIGDAIETLFHAHLDDHVEELAHHYGRSTNFEKARQYLRAAANQAMRRDAYEESVAYLNRALELLRSMAESPSRDREELTLQQALASALRVARGFGAVELEEILIRARELAERLGDTAKRFHVLEALLQFHLQRNQRAVARECPRS